MASIVPAILASSRLDLEDKLKRLTGIASEVQIDVVDGAFATPASWPYIGDAEPGASPRKMLPCTDQFRIEADLMVRNPEAVSGSWIQAGASRIVAHLESATSLMPLMQELAAKYGHEKGLSSGLLSLGIALNVDTNPDLLDPYVPGIDFVQFMGIKTIGRQGQPFAPEVIDRIAAFRKKHPDVPVQVDGGVNLETAPALLRAGVSRLIVGSALWKQSDVAGTYLAFTKLSEEYGIFEK